MEKFLESFVLASLQPLLPTMRALGPEGETVKAGLGGGRLQGRQEPAPRLSRQREKAGSLSARAQVAAGRANLGPEPGSPSQLCHLTVLAQMSPSQESFP